MSFFKLSFGCVEEGCEDSFEGFVREEVAAVGGDRCDEGHF